MKRFAKPSIAVALLLLTLSGARGQSSEPKWYETTDRFVAYDPVIDGDETYITVGIEGTENRIYMSYNFDIILPAGVTVPVIGEEAEYLVGDAYYNDEDGFYPLNRREHVHDISCAVKDNGTRAKVICISNTNKEFAKPCGKICNLYVEIHPLAKPGINRVKFRDMVLVSKDPETGYPIEWAWHNTLHNSDYCTIEIPAERTVEVNIPAADKWGSLILPFALESLPAGVGAYYVSGIDDDNQVQLKEVSRLDPYKPYLISAPEGWQTTLSGIASEADFPGTQIVFEAPEIIPDDDYETVHPEDAIATHGMLQANIKPHTRTDGYVLTVGDDMPTFTRVEADDPKTLTTGEVYLPATDDTLPATLPSVIAIEVSTPELAGDAPDSPVYDLQGHRLTAPAPGTVFVRSGHKYINN